MLNYIKKLIDYLNNNARWHDCGHILVGFFLLITVSSILGFWHALWICISLILLKELIIDGPLIWPLAYHTRIDLIQYGSGLTLAIICYWLIRQ